jgi:TPR repeat protein/serine/threonine protein kinase
VRPDPERLLRAAAARQAGLLDPEAFRAAVSGEAEGIEVALERSGALEPAVRLRLEGVVSQALQASDADTLAALARLGVTHQELVSLGVLRPDAKRDPQSMEQLGAYRIVRPIGRGGMGVVLEAVAADGSRVAIKMLTQGWEASPARQRFAREARALESIRHPNVVRVRDSGEHAGAPFLVLDFHSKGSLKALVRREELTPIQVAKLGIQLAAGLAAAHARGVLHRDVKPDNVLIGERGEPLLTDFGLAKELERVGHTQRLTQTGAIMGTPGFLAPEQAAGDPSAIGPATDVYGLGATLYSLLAGRAPFVGGLIEVVVATAQKAPPSLRHLRRDVPAELERVIMRCLEKEPRQRWDSADELGAQLEDFVAGATRRTPRGALLVGASVITTLGLAVGLASVVNFDGEAPVSPLPSRSVPLAPPSPPGVDELLRGAKTARGANRPKEALRLLTKAAKAGSSAAMFRLGTLYRVGKTAPKNAAQALDWFRQAVDLGHLGAMNDMAGLLQQGGAGVPRDEEQAARLFRRAATAGSSTAMYGLGNALTTGRGVAKDLEQAALWYRRAAGLGEVDAMYNLGVLVGSGLGGPRDSTQAVELFQRAAAAGHSGAMFNLGVSYARGNGVAQNDERAAYWYHRAAHGGDVHAMHVLGTLYGRGKGVVADLIRASAWYRRAAEQGSLESMRNLGMMLTKGEGGPKDLEQAAQWLTRSAQGGHADAMFELANTLRLGNGVPRDEERAMRWYRQATEKGHTKALHNLALMVSRGSGSSAERALSLVLLRRAATAGDVEVMFSLGAMLMAGRVVTKDGPQAASWFRRAVAQGHLGAAYNLGSMLALGAGVPKDEASGLDLLRRAASSEDPEIRTQASSMLQRLGAK